MNIEESYQKNPHKTIPVSHFQVTTVSNCYMVSIYSSIAVCRIILGKKSHLLVHFATIVTW